MEEACDDSDQREGGQSDPQEFNISVSEAQGATQIGNKNKVIHHHNQQSTSTSQINVVNFNHCPTTYLVGGEQGLSDNIIYYLQPPRTRPELNNDQQRDIHEDGYLKPAGISVLNKAALLDQKSADKQAQSREQQENGHCSKPAEVLEPCVSTSLYIGQRESGDCTAKPVETLEPNVSTSIGADIIQTSSDLSYKEMVEEFCGANEIGKRKELAERINNALHCYSVDNTELYCDVRSGESILRTFFQKAVSKSIEDRIGIYCHHLVVMLQHGLQPETINGEGDAIVRKLVDRLMNILKPSGYYPASILRKDIETVIEILSLFLAKKKTLPRNITKCFNKITSMGCPQEKKVKSYLEKYLKAGTWIHVYLIIKWLNNKVLVDLGNEKHVNVVRSVIIHYASSLHKWDKSYQWKFTITAVESLKEIIETTAGKHLEEYYIKAVDTLIDLYNSLERKKTKVKECIQILYKKARVLLYIDNLQIRSKLLENIFKDLETSSQEMTIERLKQSKTLHLDRIKTHHNGGFAFIFKADYKGCSVAVKCSKLSKNCLQNKYANSSHFSYELEFLSNLRKKNHPNIIQLIQDDRHLQCLVLEYISFGSLRTYLFKRRWDTSRPTFDELLLIAVKIAGALELLEEEGIIHLAMQARNVLVNHNGDVKLTGFQFCRTLSQIKENGIRNVVLERHFKWMDRNALEFVSVVPRTVSWSFGVFLYELLTLGCEPYSHSKKHLDSDELERKALTSSQAKIFISRGGKLPKESCIPDSCFQIISTKCCEEEYSDRLTFAELECLLLKEKESLKNVKMNPPPRIEPSEEEFRLEEHDPGIGLHDDVYPFSHLDILDTNWNLGYSTENVEERYSYGYINPDTSIREPVLGVMKWNEKGRTCKKVIVVEYMEFKDRKLVEQLQQLDCAQLVKVLHVNPFGPIKLEMISESFPEGNICDAMLCHPALRDNLKKYIPQTGLAVMYLHSQGIVHRNVKLENFLVCNQSTIKLGRLGMSMKELDENAVYTDPRDKDNTMNTTDVRWNAPEVLQWGSFSKESDVWSFGVVLWEFLRIWNCSYDEQKKDVLPYSTMSDNEVYEWVTSGNMLGDPDPRQSSNSSIYSFLCSKCWEWKTNRRASIETVAVEINKLLETSSVWERSSGRNNAKQVELDHLSDPQEIYSTEWENESDELYEISYNTDAIYEEPYEGTQQVAVSCSNNLYAALKPHSERTEENKYQSLTDVSPLSASKNDSNYIVEIEEVTDPVSEGNPEGSETTDRNCEMEVSIGMGRTGYVERLRESFLRKSYN